MTHINVIYMREGIIEDCILFIGENEKDVVNKAEAKFKEYAKKVSFDVSDEELQDALNDGSYDDLNGTEVILAWPVVEEVN